MWLKIEFTNGEVYKVPIEIIQKDKGNYYADIKEDDPPGYEELINTNLESWAKNHMTWSDLEEYAEKVSPVEFNKYSGWHYAEISIVKNF